MRVVRFLLKALGALIAIVILAIVALNLYPRMRPAPKTVRAVTTISVSAPLQFGRSFIDYLAVGGSRLYAGYTSQGMVGVIDTATNRTIATIGGLGRVHGVALAFDPARDLALGHRRGERRHQHFASHSLPRRHQRVFARPRRARSVF